MHGIASEKGLSGRRYVNSGRVPPCEIYSGATSTRSPQHAVKETRELLVDEAHRGRVSVGCCMHAQLKRITTDDRRSFVEISVLIGRPASRRWQFEYISILDRLHARYKLLLSTATEQINRDYFPAAGAGVVVYLAECNSHAPVRVLLHSFTNASFHVVTGEDEEWSDSEKTPSVSSGVDGGGSGVSSPAAHPGEEESSLPPPPRLNLTDEIRPRPQNVLPEDGRKRVANRAEEIEVCHNQVSTFSSFLFHTSESFSNN